MELVKTLSQRATSGHYMREISNLAEHGTALGLAAWGLATTGGLSAAIAIPAAVLTSIGFSRWAASDKVLLRKSRDLAMQTLDLSKDVSKSDANRALELLNSNAFAVRIDPTEIVNSMREGDPLVWIERSLGSLHNETAGTVLALRLCLTSVFDTIRNSEAHQAAFTQEICMALLRDHGIFLPLLSKTHEIVLALQPKLDRIERLLESGSLESRESGSGGAKFRPSLSKKRSFMKQKGAGKSFEDIVREKNDAPRLLESGQVLDLSSHEGLDDEDDVLFRNYSTGGGPLPSSPIKFKKD